MKPISIRLNDNERKQLEEEAGKSKLSLSDYVRESLFNSSKTLSRPSPDVIPILGTISTEINKYREDEEIEHLNTIEREVEKLWQILL